MNSSQILEREFLVVRSKILELAASLDRIQRADGSVEDDPKMKLLQQGIEILNNADSDRASKVQMLYSIGYDENWKSDYQMTDGR